MFSFMCRVIVITFFILGIITYAKFQDETERIYDFTGVEFPIFLLIFAWVLQPCDV